MTKLIDKGGRACCSSRRGREALGGSPVIGRGKGVTGRVTCVRVCVGERGREAAARGFEHAMLDSATSQNRESKSCLWEFERVMLDSAGA